MNINLRVKTVALIYKNVASLSDLMAMSPLDQIIHV